MSEAKFTPGPWHLTGKDDGPGAYHIHIGAPSSLMVLAHMNECHAQSKANSRLISAAPELYEAVKGLLEALPSSTTHPAIKAARAALAKARGEPCDTAG